MRKTSIEYIDATHQYMIDGILVPSVTTLVAYATGDIYKDIPEHILEKARIRGNGVHESVEMYERTGEINEDFKKEVEKYIELKKKYILDVKSMEQIVHYKHYYCGRYDILDSDGVLWDIKATSKFHQENLEWQLGLYAMALGKRSDVGYCIHLPRTLSKAKVYLVRPKSFEECIDLLETFESAK